MVANIKDEFWKRYRMGNDLEQLAIAVYLDRGDDTLLKTYEQSSDLLRWFKYDFLPARDSQVPWEIVTR